MRIPGVPSTPGTIPLTVPSSAAHAIKVANSLFANSGGLGSLGKVPDDAEKWPAHVLSKAHQHLPYLSEYDVSIVMERVDPEAGYGIGFLMIRNKSALNKPQDEIDKPQNYVRIPAVIRGRELAPFKTFELGGNFYPLNKERISQALVDTRIFDATATAPSGSKNLTNDSTPPYQQRQGYGRISNAGQFGGVMGKNASALTPAQEHVKEARICAIPSDPDEEWKEKFVGTPFEEEAKKICDNAAKGPTVESAQRNAAWAAREAVRSQLEVTRAELEAKLAVWKENSGGTPQKETLEKLSGYMSMCEDWTESFAGSPFYEEALHHNAKAAQLAHEAAKAEYEIPADRNWEKDRLARRDLSARLAAWRYEQHSGKPYKGVAARVSVDIMDKEAGYRWHHPEPDAPPPRRNAASEGLLQDLGLAIPAGIVGARTGTGLSASLAETVAPHGRITKAQNLARHLGNVTSAGGALTGGILGRNHRQAIARALGNKLTNNPAETLLTEGVIRALAPAAGSYLGGTVAGGLTGLGIGGAHRIAKALGRYSPYQTGGTSAKDDDAEKNASFSRPSPGTLLAEVTGGNIKKKARDHELAERMGHHLRSMPKPQRDALLARLAAGGVTGGVVGGIGGAFAGAMANANPLKTGLMGAGLGALVGAPLYEMSDAESHKSRTRDWETSQEIGGILGQDPEARTRSGKRIVRALNEAERLYARDFDQAVRDPLTARDPKFKGQDFSTIPRADLAEYGLHTLPGVGKASLKKPGAFAAVQDALRAWEGSPAYRLPQVDGVLRKEIGDQKFKGKKGPGRLAQSIDRATARITAKGQAERIARLEKELRDKQEAERKAKELWDMEQREIRRNRAYHGEKGLGGRTRGKGRSSKYKRDRSTKTERDPFRDPFEF